MSAREFAARLRELAEDLSHGHIYDEVGETTYAALASCLGCATDTFEKILDIHTRIEAAAEISPTTYAKPLTANGSTYVLMCDGRAIGYYRARSDGLVAWRLTPFERPILADSVDEAERYIKEAAGKHR
jgi:hypothetical protein